MQGSAAGGGGYGMPAELAELRGYWEALRGPAGGVPLRSAVDPRGIAGTLACAFLADRVAPGIARFRLAGAVLHDLMGMDVRGMPMLTLIDPPSRTGFARALEVALTAPAILEMWLEAGRGIGRPALTARLLLLPLLRADGGLGLALGALALSGNIGRTPRRFAVTRERLTPLSGEGRGVGGAAGAPVDVPGLAEAPAAFRSHAERPYLRLIRKGG